MATADFERPNIGNLIAEDVPGINDLVIALAKGNLKDEADNAPEGSLDFSINGTTGALTISKLSSDGTWSKIAKIDNDADTLDGYHAVTTATPSTVVVRNTNGAVVGDITGNANTATTATSLTTVNPVNMGGTGATSAQVARQNLGVPPTYHAVSSTTYGTGSATEFGHVKLIDSASSAYQAANGVAATPYAVQAVAESKAPLNHASNGTSYGGGTASKFGHVKVTDTLENSETASSSIVPSPAAVMEAIEDATAEAVATSKSFASSAVAQAIPPNRGSATRPVFTDSGGNLLASTANVGSVNQPVYMSNGQITACSRAWRLNHNTGDTWIPVVSGNYLDYVLKSEIAGTRSCVPNWGARSGRAAGVWYTAPSNGWIVITTNHNTHPGYNNQICLGGQWFRWAYWSYTGHQQTVYCYPIGAGQGFQVNGSLTGLWFMPAIV